MKRSWQNLEDHVRELASVIWSVPVVADRIDGVNFDGVAKISDEELILIETTKEYNLDKIRTDVAKIAAVKFSFLSKSILAKAFIVLEQEPTQGMLDIGKPHNISVLSLESFSKKAFDYSSYAHIRKEASFGSAINPSTGLSDEHDYVQVSYLDQSSRKSYSILDICNRLQKKEKIVLLGDYGTGKSRCVREIFNILSASVRDSSAFALAINLREHWGARSAIEIIAGHFKGLGLSSSVDRAMQLLQKGNLILLLDGFDEVGAQTFGTTQQRRATVRREALQGVRELISMSTAGVLITGRPHYFNSDQELTDTLGISSRKSADFLLHCADEFNDDQAQIYLNKIGLSSTVPKWFPRKPLMFLILTAINRTEAENILSGTSGEIGFWGQFIETVCEREAKIHTSLEPAAVRQVLTNLARMTRTSDRALGRLTPKGVNEAYELATGYAPDESGQLMLSRLCTLGRIEPESPDRQFVDPYIVQLLFADCLVEDISSKKFNILEHNWKQALQPMGMHFLAQWMEIYDLSADAITMIHREAKPINYQVIGELVAALSILEGDGIDFAGVIVDSAELCQLDLATRELLNIQFRECMFGTINFDGCKINDKSNCSISNSTIETMAGMASTGKLPSWIRDCDIERSEVLSNSSRIKSSSLPPAQKLFLSVIHKIFFQSGGGRKESSLYKGGFGQQYNRKLIDEILKILVNRGYIEKSKDGSGHIYNPIRQFTPKMKAIKDELTLSKDELWLEVAKLN